MDKIADKEANMVAMRKQFLRDNQERYDDDNYEFKRTKVTNYLAQRKSMINQKRND